MFCAVSGVARELSVVTVANRGLDAVGMSLNTTSDYQAIVLEEMQFTILHAYNRRRCSCSAGV